MLSVRRAALRGGRWRMLPRRGVRTWRQELGRAVVNQSVCFDGALVERHLLHMLRKYSRMRRYGDDGAGISLEEFCACEYQHERSPLSRDHDRCALLAAALDIMMVLPTLDHLVETHHAEHARDPKDDVWALRVSAYLRERALSLAALAKQNDADKMPDAAPDDEASDTNAHTNAHTDRFEHSSEDVVANTASSRSNSTVVNSAALEDSVGRGRQQKVRRLPDSVRYNMGTLELQLVRDKFGRAGAKNFFEVCRSTAPIAVRLNPAPCIAPEEATLETVRELVAQECRGYQISELQHDRDRVALQLRDLSRRSASQTAVSPSLNSSSTLLRWGVGRGLQIKVEGSVRRRVALMQRLEQTRLHALGAYEIHDEAGQLLSDFAAQTARLAAKRRLPRETLRLPNPHVLDFCCGSGRNAIAIASELTANPGFGEESTRAQSPSLPAIAAHDERSEKIMKLLPRDEIGALLQPCDTLVDTFARQTPGLRDAEWGSCVIARDSRPEMLDLCAERARRAGVGNLHMELAASGTLGKFRRKMDLVLVHVGATMSGSWRTCPEMKTRLESEASISRINRVVRKSLSEAASYVNPRSGLLLFSVASVLDVDTSANVTFAEERLGLRPVMQPLQLLPQLHGADGLFVVLFEIA